MNCGLKTLREWCDATLLSSRVDLRKFLLQFPEEGPKRSKMAYHSFVRREYQSFLRRIHGSTSSHFADSQRYHKQQLFVCEFPLYVHLFRWEIVWRKAPRIWRDFGSALPFQTRLNQTKPFLPLSNEHGSKVKDQGRRQCCHNRHKNFPIGLHVMYLYFPDTPRSLSLRALVFLYKYFNSWLILNLIAISFFYVTWVIIFCVYLCIFRGQLKCFTLFVKPYWCVGFELFLFHVSVAVLVPRARTNMWVKKHSVVQDTWYIKG